MRRRFTPGQMHLSAERFQFGVLGADKDLHVAPRILAAGWARRLRTVDRQDRVRLSKREPRRIPIPTHLSTRTTSPEDQVPGIQPPIRRTDPRPIPKRLQPNRRHNVSGVGDAGDSPQDTTPGNIALVIEPVHHVESRPVSCRSQIQFPPKSVRTTRCGHSEPAFRDLHGARRIVRQIRRGALRTDSKPMPTIETPLPYSKARGVGIQEIRSSLHSER
jgi:hypothetical protein